MSRVGLSARLDAIRDAFFEADPLAGRLWRLSADDRAMYDAWQAQIVRHYADQPPGAAWAAVLAADHRRSAAFPQLDETVRSALFGPRRAALLETATLAEVAAAWDAMRAEGQRAPERARR